MLEQGSSLVIRADSVAESVTTHLDVRDLPVPVIWRLLISHYRAGHSELLVTYTEGEQDVYSALSYNTLKYLPKKTMRPLEAIQALVNRLIGVEIVDQREGYCVIKELVEPSTREFHNSIRRIFLLVLTMAEESLEALKGMKNEVKAVHIVDTNLDRFEDFCIRVLNQHRMFPLHISHALHSILFLLELLGDEYKRLAPHILQTKAASKDIIKIMGKINQQVALLYELYYKYSNERAAKLIVDNDALQQLLDKHAAKNETEMVHHMKKISRFVDSLTELCMDLHVNGDFLQLTE